MNIMKACDKGHASEIFKNIQAVRNDKMQERDSETDYAKFKFGYSEIRNHIQRLKGLFKMDLPKGQVCIKVSLKIIELEK